MKKFKFMISFKIILVDIFLVLGMSIFIPILSGYPPLSESSSFQIQIEGLTHTQQYIIFGILGAALHLSFIRIFFKDIFLFLKKYYEKEPMSKEFIIKVREQCFSMNRKIIILHLAVLVILLMALFTNVQISMILCIKFLLIYFSFMMTSGIIYTILIRDNLNDVLRKTYDYYDELPLKTKKTKFERNLVCNLLPFFFIVTIITCLLGYSKVCDKLGESSYYYYKLYLSAIDYSNLTLEELKNELDAVPLKNSSDYYMIIHDKNDINSVEFSSPKGSITDFFLIYMNNFADQTDGRVYEYFGVEEQGYMKNITLADGENITIGFKYSNTSVDTVIFFVTIGIVATFALFIVLTFWAKNTTKNIVDVSNSMAEIASKKTIANTKGLPILSTDEIGDLTASFNKIQKLTYEHIKLLKDNQDTLMEKERLASLGQLIGGIAHNLKTPIMSISGAAEGLTDLIKEYEASIDNPQVNSQDHHDIAKDMSNWVDKIKDYTGYMSDVITAVKGQAVTLSETENVTFDIEELIKRVDILMKHELKNSLTYLNVSINIPEKTVLHGDINSLVQVINNMISNSIQSYDGKPEQNIDLNISMSKDNKNIIIAVKDYGPGLPDKVKGKLFNEMITTKGKNGTGLGLYMSYSTIKAHFGGDITFVSEKGKGTTFYITLPI